MSKVNFRLLSYPFTVRTETIFIQTRVVFYSEYSHLPGTFVAVVVHSVHDPRPKPGTHAEGVESGQFSCRGESNVL